MAKFGEKYRQMRGGGGEFRSLACTDVMMVCGKTRHCLQSFAHNHIVNVVCSGV